MKTLVVISCHQRHLRRLRRRGGLSKTRRHTGTDAGTALMAVDASSDVPASVHAN